MLAEHFIASVGPPTKAPGPGMPKDAAIFIHEYRPLCQQRQLLKRSATPPTGLAISPTHIFAAQSDKGVVHVYGRDKGSLEAIVPFNEKISSITLACDALVLVLGTAEGRIFLWELATGRQISTPQVHLQAVTSLTVDPTHNFLLSGSKDSIVNVWSLPSLLSFSRTSDAAPLQTFSTHRGEVLEVLVGHSSSSCNFAVSASRDQTVLVWDFHTGAVLRTYLLPAVPLCLALDPADRAIVVGYEDGTLQLLELYTSRMRGLDAVQNGTLASEPVQPPQSSRWRLSDSPHGAVTSLSISFDGTVVVSGHQSGSILSWDLTRGSFLSALTQTELPGPVNNLCFMPVTGFVGQQDQLKVKLQEIVKPKFGAFDSSASGSTPGEYSLRIQFPADLHNTEETSDFLASLTSPSFSPVLLNRGLTELASWASNNGVSQTNGNDEDYMALDDATALSATDSLRTENESLRQQLEALRRVQTKTFEKMDALNEERKALLRSQQDRLKKGQKINGIGAIHDDEDSSD